MENKNKQKIKVLAVDDEILNLKVIKRRIETTLSEVVCDIACGAIEGIEMISKGDHNLILMDIQMSGINGFEAAESVRVFNKEVPIIAYTSLDYTSFQKEAKDNFNYYLNKPANDGILFRTITKWILDYRDNFSYLKSDSYEILTDKNIIIADDQAINRIMFKKNLERFKVKVTEVSNGQELIALYLNSLDQNKRTKFDLIVADINMPPVNGDEASVEIRKIEKANQIEYQNRIPIIAISGDRQKEDIIGFFGSDMDDYFIKGSDPNSLVKIAAIYLLKNFKNVQDQKNFLAAKENLNKNSLNYNFTILNGGALDAYSKDDQKEILILFLDNSKKVIDHIKKVDWENEKQLLQHHIHSLKGICANIGAEKLYEYMKEIDLELRNGQILKNEDQIKILEEFYQELEQKITNVISNMS